MATLAPLRPPSVPRARKTFVRRPWTPLGHASDLRRWWVPGIPAAVVCALGLWGIGRQRSMWRDEAATWQVAHRSLGEIRHLLDEVDLVHGLYYALMHGLFAAFGDSLVTLRLPSVLAMALAAALTSSLGARLADPWAGLGAGLVFALLPPVQQYAQEGRAYALVTAAVALATWLLVTALEHPRPAAARWRWGAYAVTLLVGALLNWFSLLALPAHALTVALARPGRVRLTRWAMASAAAVAGALPLIVASRAQSFQVSWIRPLTWPALLGIALVVAGGCLCARIRIPHRRVGGVSLASVALPLLAVPQLALVLVSLIQPVYLVRYVLYTQVGLALLAGLAVGWAVVGMAGVRRRRLRLRLRPGALLGVAAVVAFAALLPVELRLRGPHSRVDDVLSTADRVARVARPGDAVLFVPAARRDTALVSPDRFTGLKDIALAESPERSGTLKGEEATPGEIRAAMLRERRIVVIGDAVGVRG
ncbi:protein O-mannosyl-transferase family, partial [Streptomyces sp. UNOC14_S4]|uniref:glycosyltransferase family 39 protein n=1 Tax=Streptomyces sp. UNOC14_S4 TaxID=2872340 RepID=UPI001E443E77